VFCKRDLCFSGFEPEAAVPLSAINRRPFFIPSQIERHRTEWTGSMHNAAMEAKSFGLARAIDDGAAVRHQAVACQELRILAREE
jgi:hypothetical protein